MLWAIMLRSYCSGHVKYHHLFSLHEITLLLVC